MGQIPSLEEEMFEGRESETNVPESRKHLDTLNNLTNDEELADTIYDSSMMRLV